MFLERADKYIRKQLSVPSGGTRKARKFLTGLFCVLGALLALRTASRPRFRLFLRTKRSISPSHPRYRPFLRMNCSFWSSRPWFRPFLRMKSGGPGTCARWKPNSAQAPGHPTVSLSRDKMEVDLIYTQNRCFLERAIGIEVNSQGVDAHEPCAHQLIYEIITVWWRE